MDPFSVFEFLDQSKIYHAGACVLYPYGHPFHVCVEIATAGKFVGRITYAVALREHASEDIVRRSAIQSFLHGHLRDKVVHEGGTYDGGALSE
jgi:hypothetical protein